MKRDFKDALIEFFDSHMIIRRAYFRKNLEDKLYLAGALTKAYPLSTTNKARIHHALNTTRKALIAALNEEDDIEACSQIITSCCFNYALLGDEMGRGDDWVREVSKKRARLKPDDVKYLRSEAQWVIDDIDQLLVL